MSLKFVKHLKMCIKANFGRIKKWVKSIKHTAVAFKNFLAALFFCNHISITNYTTKSKTILNIEKIHKQNKNSLLTRYTKFYQFIYLPISKLRALKSII